MAKHVVVSKEYTRNSKTSELILGALIILFGIITAVSGQGMLDLIVLVVGVFLMIYAFVDFLDRKAMPPAMIMGILGLLLLILGFYGLASSIIRVLLGLGLIIIGLIILLGTRVTFLSIGGRRIEDQTTAFCIGLILIILGVVAMLNLGNSFDYLVRGIGIVAVVYGILKVCEIFGLISIRSFRH